MILRFSTSLASFAISAIALAAAPSLFAQTTWTGATDTVWSTGSNWNNSVPGTSNAAVFNTPTANQPSVTDSARNVAGITFNQAGWTIGSDGVGTVNMRSTSGAGEVAPITSNGSGTNTIQRISSYSAVNTVVTTGAGNTLLLQNSSGFKMSSKEGAGTLVLGSAAVFQMSSLTAVNAGTLIINSANTTSIAVNTTVADGATLGGIGSLGFQRSGTHTFLSGSTLAPGTQAIGGTSAGTMSFLATAQILTAQTERIDMLSGSNIAIDIYGNGSSDTLYFGGSQANTKIVLDLNTGVTLALNGTALYDTAYTIATFEGSGEFLTGNGTFGAVTLNGNTLVQGTDYTISYTDHAANAVGTGSIAVTLLVPEPSAALLIGAALTLMTIFRRRFRP